jgi:membrane protein YqaA with SNARE-associated domain
MQESGIFQILPAVGIYAGTYIICFISGFFPLVNAEIFLVLISLNVTKAECIPLFMLAALGQMTAKLLMFLGGKGVIKLSKKRFEDKINGIALKMKKWETRIDIFIFLSAFSGIPPFYVVAIVAGMGRTNILRFFISGLLGRTLRFALVIYFPQLLKDLPLF